MALDNAKNFAKSTLASGITSGATSLTVATGDGTKFPSVSFNAVIWNKTDYADPADDPNVEIVRVTAISTDTFTVTRGQESTTGVAHNTAGKTYGIIAGLTAKVLNTDLGTGAVLQFARLGLGAAADASVPLGLTSTGESFKTTLSDITNFIQYSFYESTTKKAVIGYQGSTSSGLLGGAGAAVFGTLAATPTAFLTNGAVQITITQDGTIQITKGAITQSGTADHITLTPGASKLVRIAVYANTQGTGAYQNNSIIVCGVNSVVGNSTIEIGGTITYGVTFTATPIILISNAGVSTAQTGTVGGFYFADFGYMWGTNIKNAGTTSVSFDVRCQAGSTMDSSHYWFSSWIAIGTI
jgi:hypothetical protein